MSSFEIPGFEEFIERAEAVVDKWDAKKQELLQKMGGISLEEISPLIPVDTSRLVSSFQIGTVTPNYAEVGTNVDYAVYVNDGHVQHRRFLPLSYLSAKGRRMYISNRKGNGETMGIMLKERYIPGTFFLEKGMKQAEPRMKKAIESWMEDIAREIEGAG